jgi:hypothetical protein
MTTEAKRRRQRSEDLLDRPEIDFFLLADRAEGINGKLYVMGGGWQQIQVIDFGQPVQFSLAVGILIPWNATNAEQQLNIYIETEDGTRIPPELPLRFNTGRPATAIPGQEFRTIIAINGSWKLPGPGVFRAKAELADTSSRRATFRVSSLARPIPSSMQ